MGGQTTYTSFSNERSTNFYLTGNLALGYAIGRFEALGELGASTNLETLKYEDVGRFTPGFDLGLRYKFGQRQ